MEKNDTFIFSVNKKDIIIIVLESIYSLFVLLKQS